MHVCVVSFKECWQDDTGQWVSYGGFPLQMAGIGTLFDEMTMVIIRGRPRAGGLPLPPHAKIMPLQRPTGDDTRRKLSVATQLPYYLNTIKKGIQTADVVHTPVPGDISLLGLWMALLFRKKLLVRYGGSWIATSQTTLMNRVTRESMRRFAGGRNVMLATGDGVEPPAPKMHWIFSTALSEAELSQIQPSLERGLSTSPRLMYAGRLSPEKGVANLIKAIAALKQESFGLLPQVTLAGDGPQRAELEALIMQLDCAEQVSLVGQLNRAELSQAFLEADICVQPSLTEGFSKAWLDAMAHGLPVIASEVGAGRAVIGDQGERGWLLPPNDVPALTAMLREVVTISLDWPALRHRCRTYVEGRTLEAWSQEIGQVCATQWGVKLIEGKLRP
ncbi:MAG: glycosyltransferase [Chloroflexota bacterium]